MKFIHMMVCALALSTLSTLSCATEGDARASLQEDGYTDIKITGKGDDGYTFTAKSKDGKSCKGTIKITKGVGSTQTNKMASCE